MSSLLKEHVIKTLNSNREAYIINEGQRMSRLDYILNAEEGKLVAFRLNFESVSGTKLTKVISGKILENNKETSEFIVETRNGLKYGVPYDSVVWVKEGDRWPKSIFMELKKGAVEVSELDEEGLVGIEYLKESEDIALEDDGNESDDMEDDDVDDLDEEDLEDDEEFDDEEDFDDDSDEDEDSDDDLEDDEEDEEEYDEDDDEGEEE